MARCDLVGPGYDSEFVPPPAGQPPTLSCLDLAAKASRESPGLMRNNGLRGFQIPLSAPISFRGHLYG
jgi:hypothetical protein